MELNITKLYKDDCSQFSASIAETGLQNIGEITWHKAMGAITKHSFATEKNREELQDYFESFGAWQRSEIEAWDLQELNALVVQFIAGNIREREAFESWEEYEEASEQGSVSGSIYLGDDGEVYAYLGS